MQATSVQRAISAVLLASVAACGGGGSYSGSGTMPGPTPQSVTAPIVVSDASNEDWATIGVKVLSIALIPQGGGMNVTVYTDPSPAPVTNLVNLDQIGELMKNAKIPVGPYTAWVLTMSANPGDVQLVVSSDPETGFAAAHGSTIPTNQI